MFPGNLGSILSSPILWFLVHFQCGLALPCCIVFKIPWAGPRISWSIFNESNPKNCFCDCCYLNNLHFSLVNVSQIFQLMIRCYTWVAIPWACSPSGLFIVRDWSTCKRWVQYQKRMSDIASNWEIQFSFEGVPEQLLHCTCGCNHFWGSHHLDWARPNPQPHQNSRPRHLWGQHQVGLLILPLSLQNHA